MEPSKSDDDDEDVFAEDAKEPKLFVLEPGKKKPTMGPETTDSETPELGDNEEKESKLFVLEPGKKKPTSVSEPEQQEQPGAKAPLGSKVGRNAETNDKLNTKHTDKGRTPSVLEPGIDEAVPETDELPTINTNKKMDNIKRVPTDKQDKSKPDQLHLNGDEAKTPGVPVKYDADVPKIVEESVPASHETEADHETDTENDKTLDMPRPRIPIQNRKGSIRELIPDKKHGFQLMLKVVVRYTAAAASIASLQLPFTTPPLQPFAFCTFKKNLVYCNYKSQPELIFLPLRSYAPQESSQPSRRK